MLESNLFRASEYPALPRAGMNEARTKPNRPRKLRPSMGGEASFYRFQIKFGMTMYRVLKDFLNN